MYLVKNGKPEKMSINRSLSSVKAEDNSSRVAIGIYVIVGVSIAVLLGLFGYYIFKK